MVCRSAPLGAHREQMRCDRGCRQMGSAWAGASDSSPTQLLQVRSRPRSSDRESRLGRSVGREKRRGKIVAL